MTASLSTTRILLRSSAVIVLACVAGRADGGENSRVIPDPVPSKASVLSWRYEKTSIKWRGAAVAPLDIDQDGDVDLVFIEGSGRNTRPGRVRAWLNDGKGRFRMARKREWLVGKGPKVRGGAVSRPLLHDFNGDGLLDIHLALTGFTEETPDEPDCSVPGVCPGSRNLLLLTQPDGRYRFSDTGTSGVAGKPSAADVDGDGDVDIWEANILIGDGVPHEPLQINDGAGTFRGSDQVTEMCHYEREDGCLFGAVEFCDIEGDGDPDLIATANAVSDLSALPTVIMVNDGKGVFSDSGRSLPHAAGRFAEVLDWACEDFDRDGDFDLVMLEGSWCDGFDFAGCPDPPPEVSVIDLMENRGKGRYKNVVKRMGQSQPMTGTFAGNMSTVDFNNDGWVDVLVPGEQGYRPRIFLNRGSRKMSFSEFFFANPPFRSANMYPFDADGDGRIDILALARDEQLVLVLYNETSVKVSNRSKR